MKQRAGLFLVATIAAGILLVPGAAASTVVVGSPLTASFAPVQMCESICTAADTLLPEPGANVASPVDGTIVRWHVLDASGGEFELRVLRPAAGGGYTAVGSSAFELPAGEALQTFTSDLPVQAGDLIGLDNSSTAAKIGEAENPGSRVSLWRPPLAEGATTGTPVKLPLEAAFNAEVETTPTVEPPPSAAPAAPASAAPPTAAPATEAQCVVPKLKGKKLKRARKKLRASGCRLGKVRKEDGATARTGKVVRQGARSGTVLAAGSKVTVALKP